LERLADNFFAVAKAAQTPQRKVQRAHDARPLTGAGRALFVCPLRPFDLYFSHSFHLPSAITQARHVIMSDNPLPEPAPSAEAGTSSTATNISGGVNLDAQHDVVMSLVGTLGKVLIVPERIEQGKMNPRLLKVSPITWREMDILNAGLLKELRAIAQPLAQQVKFASIVRQYNRLPEQQCESLRQAETPSAVRGAIEGEFSTSPLPLKARDLRLTLPEPHRHLRPLLAANRRTASQTREGEERARREALR
jgi:hypothetical protein